MFVDVPVSRKKFNREVEQFRAQADAYHRRGVWLLEATFPNVFIVFVAVHTKPFPSVAFGVLINFENYDVVPPSVRFVNPLTRELLKKKELPHPLATQFQRIPVGPGQFMDVATNELVQGFDDEAPPFVCQQGVREYHEHPGHTGDSWWLHRKGGFGTLSHISNLLAQYGVDGIRGLRVQLQPQITGFMLQSPGQ